MGIMENDESVTRRYFYSIKDISIGGRCDCNGHAKECKADMSDSYRLACQCKHNTMGISCQECKPLFNQRKWMHAERNHDNECKMCNCHNHADRCYYDEVVERKGLSLNMQNKYEGGGVCVECQHNTDGINCEKCAKNYYRNQDVPIDSEIACLECNCPSNFTDTSCDHDTGACRCKDKYTGHNCDGCAEGFTDFPECRPCTCHYDGTSSKQCSPTVEDGQPEEEGICECKENFSGQFCNECADGYFNFPDCVPCECSDKIGAVGDAPCDKATGQCQCRPAYAGLHCEECALRHHNYPQCERCYCSEEGCYCSERYIGEKCNECDVGYHTFPTCAECQCAEVGTIKGANGEMEPCDSQIGQCQCKPEYTGIQCDQCQDGYYRDSSGFCIPCECDLNGSETKVCDKTTGECVCQTNADGIAKTQGRTCDTCSLGFFNFPTCESCPCHPDGIFHDDKSFCSYFVSGECTCKKNVRGDQCKKCANRYWNLSGDNPDGCEECGCFRSGLMNEIKDCSSDDGQCNCKTRVCTRQCSMCEDGFYGLEEKNYFGCVACQCDVGGTKGGHLAKSCDSNDGQCECKDHITGRRCDDIEEGYCYPTLFQYQFEAEDGLLDNGDRVRYGFDKSKFDDFSLRGYAELSDIQPTVILHGAIESSSLHPTVPLYKTIVRYLNPYDVMINAKLSIYDIACETDPTLPQCDQRQEIEINFVQTETAETKMFKQDAVLVPGEYVFKLEIQSEDVNWKEDGLFVDFLALLPDEYYEPKILKQKVNEPCKYRKQADGKCMMFTHFPLPIGSVVQTYSKHKLPISSNYVIEPPMVYNTETGDVQPFPKMMLLDASDRDNDVIYAQMTVPRPGDYVFIMDYVNKIDRLQTLSMTVEYKKDGVTTHSMMNFNSYSCDFLFTCRQVGLSLSRNVEILTFDSSEIYLSLKDAMPHSKLKMYIDKIYVIPAEEWDIELITPKPLGISENGPKFSGNVDDASYPPKPSVAAQISLSEVLATSTAVGNQIEQIVPTSVRLTGNYIFVFHYQQETSRSFNLTVSLKTRDPTADIRFDSGTVEFTFCPNAYGCRAVLYGTGGKTFTIEKTEFDLVLLSPIGQEFEIDYILAIPEPNWSLDQLNLADIDLANAFIKNCGFHIDPSDPATSDFCKSSARSLVISNTSAKQCKCAQAGTVNNSDQCDPYGCQCQCKPHCIGHDCSRCEVGYYGWPECKKCDCVGNTICHEDTGECMCPKNTAADCLSCQEDAYGYHHISGCNLCECHVNGTINGEKSCDQQDGHCACKENITGRKCDQCLPGYYGFPNCKKCSCDERGTIGLTSQCDVTDGSCLCKSNVDGPNCSRCKEGTFFLAKDHPEGCISCFCSGLVNSQTNYAECKASDHALKVITDMTIGTEINRWLVSGMKNTALYRDRLIHWDDKIVLDIAKGGGQGNRGNDDSYAPKPLYWIAPPTYNGNRLGSYGGYLEYSLRWDEEKKDKVLNSALPRLNTDPDLYLTGGGMTIAWCSANHRTDISNITIKVPLMENGFTSTATKAAISRKDLLSVLKDLQEIKIKASYPIAVSEIEISGLTLQDTDFEDQLKVDYTAQEGSDYAHLSRVEVCSCPPGHTGSSCESCLPGYYWEKKTTGSSRFQRCQKCKCHNHCENCDDDGYPFISKHIPTMAASSAGIREIEIGQSEVSRYNETMAIGVTDDYIEWLKDQDSFACNHHTTGSECQFCEPGFIGNPLDGTPEDCKPCPCPLENHNHAESCRFEPKEETDLSLPSEAFIDSDLMVLLSRAANDNPEQFDITCQCKEGYTGGSCDECAPGWFGNPAMLNQFCKKCDCNGNSDMSSGHVECDSLDGTCTNCAHGTAGKNCEICEPFKFGNALEKNCTDCSCDLCGSVSCDDTSGSCGCKNNVIGVNCDQCAPGFWDFDSCLVTGCRDCKCDVIGSIDARCDSKEGFCNCKPGVGGYKCDQCQKGFYDLQFDGCKKCNCPADLPCDAKTGKCFCPPGIIGEQCDTCENSRAVPKDIFGKTRCETCDQCIDWLLGPRDGEIWFNKNYTEKALQIYTEQVVAKKLDLENTKAGGLANRKLNRIRGEFEQIKSSLNIDNVTRHETYNSYRHALENFDSTHLALYSSCNNTHIVELFTKEKDKTASNVYDVILGVTSKVDKLLQQSLERKESLEKTQRDTGPEKMIEAEDKLIETENILNDMQKIRNQSRVDEELELAKSVESRVLAAYDYSENLQRANVIFNKNAEINDKLNQFKEFIDEINGNLSTILDINTDNEVNEAKVSKKIQQLTTDINSILKTINDLIEKNHHSREATANATLHVESIFKNYAYLNQSSPTAQKTFEKIKEKTNLYLTIIESMNHPDGGKTYAERAKEHAAKIRVIAEDFERFFDDVSPGLDDKISMLKSQNRTQIVNTAYANHAEALKIVTSLPSIMVNWQPQSPAVNSITTLCNKQTQITNSLSKSNENQEKYVEQMRLRDEQVAQWDWIQERLDSLESKEFEQLGNNLDNHMQKEQEMLSAGYDNMFTTLKNLTTDLSSGIEFIESWEAGSNPTNQALRAGVDAAAENVQNVAVAIENVGETAEQSLDFAEDVLAKNKDDFEDMTETINKIQEEIERARTLVKQLSEKSQIELQNEHTIYDEESIPNSVDLRSETILEVTVKVNDRQSHLASIVSKNNSDFVTLEVVDRRPRMVFRSRTGSEPEIIQSHRQIFAPKLSEQKWYNIIAKRVGSHAVLIVSDFEQEGKSEATEKTSLKNAVFSRLRRETAEIIMGSLPAERKPEKVNNSESNIEISSLKLNNQPIYIWEFSSKSGNFDKSNEEIDVDVDPDTPKKSSFCPDCWQFSGENSWIYINEQSHSKYMLNKESGTIMFQLKLKAPIYADGLIFFIGDPEQTDFFIAFELLNGRPQFSYNLGYDNGPTTVSLNPKQTKYIPTQYGTLPHKELNFRIGMVGGVAGLAVQEWRANRVVSVENDYWLKTKSEVCEGCEFKIKNELHFGGIKALGRDLSHLSQVLKTWDMPYRGCMGPPKINHQILQLAQEGLARSNVMEGCRPDSIHRISLSQGQMIQREKLKTSLADFTATFAISIMGGFTSQRATIFRVKASQGPDLIELKMKNGKEFVIHSDFDGEKDLVLPDQYAIVADQEIQILIQRVNGEHLLVKIGEFEKKFDDVKRIENSDPQDVEIALGGHFRGKDVKNYFNGCIISPYIRNLKDSETGKRLFSVLENFQCKNTGGFINCFGEVSFNKCVKNIPQSLMLRPVRNEVLTVLRDRDEQHPKRSKGRGRGRGKRKCPKIDDEKIQSPLKVEKYKLEKNSLIKMNQKNFAEFFKDALEIEASFEYEKDGSLLQLVNEDCSESISILIIEGHVRLILKIDGHHMGFTSDSKLASGKNDLKLAITPESGKTKFSLILNGSSKTKKVKKNLTRTSIKSIYIGKSPDNLKCSDLAHPHSFKGHFFGAKINGANLKTRRFENAPAILGGARIPGVFLGKKSSLNFGLNGENLKKISLTVRTRQEIGELFAIQNASKDTQLVLQMKPKKFLLSLRIRSKVANLVMDYEECMTKPLKITVEIGQDENLRGLRLTVNRAKKTKEVNPGSNGVTLDGHVTLSNHGCVSDLEINGKEPILDQNTQTKGDTFSLDGCPKN